MEKEFRVEDLQSAIYALEEAMDALKALKDYDASVDCIESLKAEVQAELDEINAELDAEAAADRNALEREYWKAVI